MAPLDVHRRTGQVRQWLLVCVGDDVYGFVPMIRDVPHRLASSPLVEGNRGIILCHVLRCVRYFVPRLVLFT